MEDLYKNVSADNRPAVVWIYDPEDDSANQRCEANIFRNEQVGIALKKFRTLRIDVDAISSQKIREEYAKRAPSFHFFDPKGEFLTKVEGKKATSLSSFSRLMDKTWNKSYNTKLRTYAKGMTKILDRLDRLTGKKTILTQQLARLAQKPNPRKAAALKKTETALAKEEAKILEDEQTILAKVALRPQYLPKKDKVAQK